MATRACVFAGSCLTVGVVSTASCAEPESASPTGRIAEGFELPAEPSIGGGWEALEYRLATGESHPLRGRILFTDDEWVVLFFVMDGDEARRGSGEGGRYTLSGETLTFEHLFNLSVGEELDGLPASPLRLSALEEDGASEPTRVELGGNEMTLLFPSGNAIRFRRSSGAVTPEEGAR